jgi:hypothetical protein
MSKIPSFVRHAPGVTRPASGSWTPRLGVALLLGTLLAGCGSTAETERTLPPVKLAMTPDLAPFYDDGEIAYYEVRLEVPLPILAASRDRMRALQQDNLDPYGRRPWITLKDTRVQLSWTLTNLDSEEHTVSLLVDPWNEFARYYPGLQVVDSETGESIPNLSGIEYLYLLKGRNEGSASRLSGTFTYDDMDELARDFATVMSLLQDPPPAIGGGDASPDQDPTLAYVNHLFAFQNHSDRDPLIKSWIPEVIAGLTGFDLGLRTTEPATIAVEVVVELVDLGHDRVQMEHEGQLIDPPDEVITLGQ